MKLLSKAAIGRIHTETKRLIKGPLPVLRCEGGPVYLLPREYRFAVSGECGLAPAQCHGDGTLLYLPVRMPKGLPLDGEEKFSAFLKMENGTRSLLEQTALEAVLAELGADLVEAANYSRLVKPDRWISAAELLACVRVEPARRCQPPLFS